MNDANNPYVYKPLQAGEVRLLYFDNGGDDQPKVLGWCLRTIHMDLTASHQNQNNLPVFDALSYTWGDLSETIPFVCDGRELHIHRNLRDALPHLARRGSFRRPIWVDAVCINQRDEAEKYTQIRLMHHIYRQASTVWLGQSLDKQPLPRWTATPLTPESVGLPDRDSSIWEPVQRIVCNNWFRRVWAVQEFASARNITFLYGTHEIDTTVIEDVVVFGNRLQALRDSAGLKLPSDTMATNRGMVRIRRLVGLERTATDKSSRCIPDHLLGTVVFMTQSHECFEPRDRVLGVLGFLEGYNTTKLAISETTSLVDLYTNFSHFLLTHADQSQIH
ncbi:heterokaryon incompatibility protein-domain-containing protein [Astrocystis sublimbata]|nr:heterokaryon incompatibility protein-domain-containing protein [Astrocystis sublimbata]